MRLRIERAERRGLDDAASHLLRPQPCHGKGRPVLLRLGMIAEAGGFKNPRGGDRTDETMKIEIMRDEILRQQLHAGRKGAIEREIIHRRNEGLIEQKRPQAIHQRAGKGLVFLRGDPIRQL